MSYRTPETTAPSPSDWRPATKAEAKMLKQYRGWSKQRRMKAAIEAVLNERDTLSQIARNYGVSREQLSRRVSEIRTDRTDAARIAEAVAANEAAAAAGVGPQVIMKRKYGPWGEVMPSYREFDAYYFGHWRCNECVDPATGEAEWHATPEYIYEAVEATLVPGKHQVLMPPNHSKTSHLSVRRSIYRICQNPNVRILIISKADALASDVLGAIKEMLTNEELYQPGKSLIQDFGPFWDPALSRAWSADRIFVAGRTTAHKDPTVETLGRGGSVYGKRADDIILDDFVDYDRSINPENVEKDVTWVTRQVSNRISQKYGVIVDVGTRVHPGDAHGKFLRREDFQTRILPAIIEPRNDDNPEGTCLWPEHISMEILEEEKENDPINFELVYQQTEAFGITSSFTPELVEPALDKERIVGHFETNWLLVAGLDPAGGGEYAGYTAFVLRGIDMITGRRYLVDIINVRSMKSHQIKDEMLRWSETYPIHQWRVEANGMNSQVIQYDTEIVSALAKRGIAVLPHQTHGNKWDPQFGVESQAPLFRAGLVSIPWGNRQSRQVFQPYLDQLYSFPVGELSDIVMADWFAELGLREVYQRAGTPLFHSRTRVPRRLARKRRILDTSTGVERGVPLDLQHPGVISGAQGGERRALLGVPRSRAEIVPGPPPEPEEDPWMIPGDFANVPKRKRHANAADGRPTRNS